MQLQIDSITDMTESRGVTRKYSVHLPTYPRLRVEANFNKLNGLESCTRQRIRSLED